jgi:hypothetical protein
MRHAALLVLAIGSPVMLTAFVVGGRWAEWVFVLIAMLFPAALCALGAAGRGRRSPLPWILGGLVAILELTAIGILLLGARGTWVLGLPPATALMLVGFGLVPLLWTGLGYAVDFRGADGESRPDARREPGEGRRG